MIAPKLMNVFGVAACLGTAALLVHVTVSDKEPAGSALIGPQTVQAVPSERPATGRSVRDAGQERLLAADLSSGERPGLDQTTLSDPYAGALQQESIIILSQDSDATGGQYASADVSGGSTILFGSDGDSIWRSYSGSEDLASAALAGGSGGGSGFSTGGSSAGGGSAATGDLDFAGGDGGEADEDLIVIPIGGDTDTGGDTAPGGDDAWDGDIPVYDDPLDTGDDPGAGDTPVDTGGTGGGTGARDDTPVGDDTDTGQDSPTAPDDGSQDTGDGGQDATTPDDATPDPDTGSGSGTGGSVITPRPWIRPGDSAASGAVFYVDPQTGDDSNDGSSSQPWRTAAYAVRQLAPGDVLRLRSGNYGTLELGGSQNTYGTPERWLIYEADAGHTPVFESMTLRARSDTLLDYFVEIRGLTIRYPTPTAGNCLRALDVQSIVLRDLFVQGNWNAGDGRYTPSGLYFTGTGDVRWANVVVANCEIRDCSTGIMLVDDSGIDAPPETGETVIYGNYVHHIAGSSISVIRRAATGPRVLVEANHIYDQEVLPYPPYDGTHGTGISLRSRNVCVRRNVIHSSGSTRSIRTYPNVFDGATTFTGVLRDADKTFVAGEDVFQGSTLVGKCVSATDSTLALYRAADNLSLTRQDLMGQTSGARFCDFSVTSQRPWGGYRGLVIENNLVYDSLNMLPIELCDASGDLVFRQNTVVGAHKNSGGAHWYGTVLMVTPAPYGSEGDSPVIRNNVFVGRVYLLTGIALTRYDHNIAYALYANDSYVPSLDSNIIITDVGNPAMARRLFFEPGDLGRDFFIGGPGFSEYSFRRTEAGGPHGVELSACYQLALGSPGINFGDVQTAIDAGEPCGIVGPNGFLTQIDQTRGTDRHSAGCYELSAVPPVE